MSSISLVEDKNIRSRSRGSKRVDADGQVEELTGFQQFIVCVASTMTTTSGRKTVKTLVLILIWYVLSTGLSLYNKQLVGRDHGLFGKGAFPAPLFMSSIQFALQTVLAKLVFSVGLAQRTMARRMPWSDYFRMVVPNGVTTGLDIGFSNKSLVFINLSFYTMCKSTVPVFLLFFAFIWGIEKPNWELLAVVLVIVSGLFLLVRGETKFDMLGFGLVMTASCLSGLRFTLTQVLLHGHQSAAALGGPLEVLELLTPVMSITVMVFSLAWEELWDVLPGSPYFDGFEHSVITSLVIAAGAVIAFLMVWAEYQVIKETSALTFMIAGTVKEVVTVITAMVVMGDELTWVNALGLVIVIMGVLLFNYYKYRKLKTGDAPVYTALESTGKEDAEALGGDSKHRGRSGHFSGGDGGPMDVVPISAAAVAAGTGGAGAGAGAGGQYTSHHAASTLLGRALAGIGVGAGGGGGGARHGGGGGGGLEMSPLLATGGLSGGVHEGPGSSPRGLAMSDSAPTGLERERDGGGGGGGGAGGWGRSRESSGGGSGGGRGGHDDDDGVGMVGLGNSGGTPAVAVSVSGGGMSGPHRGPQRVTRGLSTAAESEVQLLSTSLPSASGGAAAR